MHIRLADSYRDGAMAIVFSRKLRASAKSAGLRADEIALLALLKYLQNKDSAGRRAA